MTFQSAFSPTQLVSADLFCHSTELQVCGPDTSGEVEFVMLSTREGLGVAVGSDHTDRKAETMGLMMELEDPVPKRRLKHEYRIEVLTVEG